MATKTIICNCYTCGAKCRIEIESSKDEKWTKCPNCNSTDVSLENIETN